MTEFRDGQIYVRVLPTSRTVSTQAIDAMLYDKDVICRDEIYCMPQRGKEKLGPKRGLQLHRPFPSDGERDEVRLFVEVRFSSEILHRIPDGLCLQQLSLDIHDLCDPRLRVAQYEVKLEEDYDLCIRVEDDKIPCHKVYSQEHFAPKNRLDFYRRRIPIMEHRIGSELWRERNATRWV